MQDQIEYLMEFIDIQGEIIEEKTGCRQPELSVEQKKRLAHRGKKLNEFLLGQIENTFAPSTVLKWYSELISNKYNSVGANQKKRGRKPGGVKKISATDGTIVMADGSVVYIKDVIDILGKILL